DHLSRHRRPTLTCSRLHGRSAWIYPAWLLIDSSWSTVFVLDTTLCKKLLRTFPSLHQINSNCSLLCYCPFSVGGQSRRAARTGRVTSLALAFRALFHSFGLAAVGPRSCQCHILAWQWSSG